MGVFRKTSGQRFRRGLLGLQEFLDPGAAHVIKALDQQVVEDEEAGGGDPPGQVELRELLEEALGRTPVDPEEVRQVLTQAQDLGLAPRTLFDEVVSAALAARPSLAPHVPIWSRVAPVEAG